MLNSFQTVIILMVISRIDNITDSGNFVIAYAVANLLIMIGKYGVRQFQVSDISEKYSFKTYFTHRIITVFLMTVCSIFYVAFYLLSGSYSLEKSLCILLICGVKAVDAFEDVIHGMFQQHSRLDIAGKILSLRLFLYTIEFMVIYFFTHNLLLTSLICFFTALLLCIFLNGPALASFDYVKGAYSTSSLYKLCKECFPIFVSTFLMAYVANAPKYSIDIVLSSQEQAMFNYIFMPIFVISLLSTFIYQPMINGLAIIWSKHDLKHFWKLIAQQILLIFAFTILALVGGYFLGIPILSLLYSADLASYKSNLLILLAGGGMLALVNFLTMVITITRYQKHLIWGYLFISLLFILFGKRIAELFGVSGISVFYTACMTLLALIFFVYVIFIAIFSGKKNTSDNL